jgi:hypothetical protein
MKIANKKQFIRAMITILLTIVGIVLVTMFMNNLKVNGLGSLFTIPAYEEAFEVTKTDIAIINILEVGFMSSLIFLAYDYLDYHAQIIKLEREERLAIENI